MLKSRKQIVSIFSTHDLFREFGKSLSIVTTKWESRIEASVEGWHGIYAMSVCITIDK
jgi:hypothetical protein